MIPQKPLGEKQNPGAKRTLDKKYQEEFNKKQVKKSIELFFFFDLPLYSP